MRQDSLQESDRLDKTAEHLDRQCLRISFRKHADVIPGAREPNTISLDSRWETAIGSRGVEKYPPKSPWLRRLHLCLPRQRRVEKYNTPECRPEGLRRQPRKGPAGTGTGHHHPGGVDGSASTQ